MMHIPKISMLRKSDRDMIHEQSLDILQKVGIQFNSRRAVSLLREVGCNADLENLVVKFPPEVIDKALETVPAEIFMAGRRQENDFICGGGGLHFCSSGGQFMMRDLETRIRRPATSNDLRDCLRLVEGIDEIHEWCPMVHPMEIHPMLRGLKITHLSLVESTKHLLGSPETREELPYFLDMVTAVAGDVQRLKERPLISALLAPASPLQNSSAAVGNVLDMIDFTPPIFMQFLPLSGATAPITLAGTVIQANAEFLGNMTLFQTAAPGWPIIWACATGSIDMKTAEYIGGPEAMLMNLALIEMAKRYGVPVNTFAASASETQAIGYRTGMESMFGLLVGALADVDHMWWPADIDRLNTCDMPLTVLGIEAVRQIQRVKEGMSFEKDRVQKETILQMGFKADYMSHASTNRYFQREYLMPDLFPRYAYEDWVAAGEPTDDAIAISKVNEIIAAYEPDPLPREVVDELERIYKAAEAALR